MTNHTYWEIEGHKTFNHPLQLDWSSHFDKTASVLDLGYGYDRITKELYDHGFASIIGYDLSHALIKRAKAKNPGPQ